MTTETKLSTLPPKVLNSHLCASKDPTRYMINAVRVDGDTIVATSGSTLIQTKLKEDTGLEISIPRETAKELAKTKAHRLILEEDYPKGYKASANSITTAFPEVQGMYPNYASIIPDDEKMETIFRLNPFKVIEALQALIKVNGLTPKGAESRLGSTLVEFKVNKDEPDRKPAVFEVVKPENHYKSSLAIVMPLAIPKNK